MVIAHNEGQFEIFVDVLRKTTNDLRIIDIGTGHPTIFSMNVTVLLIASMPVMYLGKRRNECRNFNGGPLGKTHLGN